MQKATLDQHVLSHIRALQEDTNSNILHKVIDIYLEDAPKVLATLQQALHDDDSTALAKIAHRLKSGGANLGALQLAEYCHELESRGRNGTTEGASDLVKNIEREYARVEIALKDERARA